ncbi:transposase [Anaerophilus nitritogenes]|uniref:transposase n=1 Tax=Anaerophilus nitritogenes TaxID=2498136 RepID=UPI00101CCD3F|nr:transposase [Anaerophilus nitritogenes]
MPRHAREKSNSGIYHIMLRGINKQNIFEDDEDRQKFIEVINRYKIVSEYEVYGYCLMDNHVHLLMKEFTESISTAIKRISSSYVYWYNDKYDRCGHLFQERFKSENVESDEYFLMVLRYIHQNPLKAGIVKNLDEYKWSSYLEYSKHKSTINKDFTLKMYSEDRKKAVELFMKYTKEKNNDKCLEYEEKRRVTDEEVLNCIHQLGLSNTSKLQQLEKTKRDEIIHKIKSVEGITIRQIARITGISKSVISRI